MGDPVDNKNKKKNAEHPISPQIASKDENKSKKKKKNAEHHSSAQIASNNENQSNKKSKIKEVAIFGNYRHYYGYRIGEELEEDPRLKLMKKEWFYDKDCLDIGCNSGVITISIAKKFCCRSILGIDIDRARIEDANWTLRNSVNKGSCKTHQTTPKPTEQRVKQQEVDGTLSQSELQPENTQNSDQGTNLFDVVSFQKGNFVQNWYPPENKLYGAILCLSVTKWIHLNWGDDGLINLFSKVWRLLEPGGVFILEPQPWTSYSKNRNVSETASSNYKSIQIGPEDFQDILLDKVGFRTVEHLTSNLPGSKIGFDRPVLAFWK